MRLFRIVAVTVSLLALIVAGVLSNYRSLSQITGFYLKEDLARGDSYFGFFFGIIAVLAVLIFIYANRGNLKEFSKNLFGTFALLSGLYVIIKYIRDVELLSGILTLTFGVWAIIWTLNARSVLSKGSSIRRFATSFFFCLLFILVLSVLEITAAVFEVGDWFGLLRNLILIFAYTTFVFAAYKIYKIGKEFGFEREASRIKQTISKRKSW